MRELGKHNSKYDFITKKSWTFGLTAGLLVILPLTIVMTAWNWIENPGGIFRGPQGTNWSFIWETAESWLWPALLYTSVGFGLLHLIFTGAVKLLRKPADTDTN